MVDHPPEVTVTQVTDGDDEVPDHLLQGRMWLRVTLVLRLLIFLFRFGEYAIARDLK